MKVTKENLQHIFATNFSDLINKDADQVHGEQSHFGDILTESVQNGSERFRLWKVLDCNGGGLEVEYCGALTGYTWKVIYTTN